MTTGLAELEAAIRRDLDLLSYPARDWRTARATAEGHPILDVLIIGGGQGGLGVAFGLLRERVDNILVVDQNPRDHAGPWRTFARMITLRTPKYLAGIDQGIPNLTVQAWYEARYGEAAWRDVNLIPKEDWAAYLSWYRDLLGIPVRHDTRVGALEYLPAEKCFAAPVSGPEGEKTLYARKVVLATGIDGSGHWQVPEIVRGLPEHLYAHTRDDIDFEALRGKRIGVLGAGASAFDNASVALETGAAEVRLFYRRDRLPNVNPYRWAEFVGFLKHHADLPDADRWRFIRQILRMGQLPPPDTFARARQFSSFHLHGASPWTRVERAGDGVRVTTPHGEHEFDFIILGTGFTTDLSRRPELANLHRHIALWSDRYTPPASEAHEDLERHPYLGPSFELTPKKPDDPPWVSSIFNYTFGCLLSLGFGGASISGMKYSLPKVVYGLTRQLYEEDRETYYRSLESYAVEEFDVSG
jgi:cation diffusion facilitator CzcD-associated flavoprotein CzcO